MNRLAQIFSTLFFIGYIQKAPGTLASIASLIICYFLNTITKPIEFFFIFFCLLILSLISIHIYSKTTNSHDAKEIVIDEFLGIYLIIIYSNFYISLNEFIKIFCIFILFRFFDILKPFPINWIDKKIKNSFGVILDDIIAGIYTIIVLSLINAFIQ